jgi:Tol biopolymer transport system component
MKKIFLSAACFGLLGLSIGLLSAQNSSNKRQSLPVLFAEGIINTGGDEYNPTFTPDGQTIYFTRRIDRKGNEAIMFSKLANGKWTAPETAPFSGKFYDKEPMLAPDGKRIFFASTRPNGRDAKANFDIWMAEKTAAGGWSEPKNLGANVNSSGYDNYPSIAADGTLYFASVRQDGRKDNDLYRSRLVDGEYQKAENLGSIINTPATEADPFIAPDESYLIICSDREGGVGEGDLYISFNEGGKWTAPQSLGKTINTAEYEYTPLVSADGKTFYFSRGWGDIYQIDLKALNLSELRKTASTIDSKAKYLFYLHGKIVEDQGARAVSEKHGAYEYEKIVEGFRAEGFNVVSEARPAETDVEKYAGKVAVEIRGLLKDGVAPENITVVGASKGAFIAMLASTYVKNKNVNYVIIAGCGAGEEFLKLANLYGNVLSIYEKSDVTGSCRAIFDDAEGLNKQKEVMLETNLAHGFLYRPMREWLIPTLDWAHYQK